MKPGEYSKQNNRPDFSYRDQKYDGPTPFSKFASDGDKFIDEVGDQLGVTNTKKVLRITRAVLQALRDRMQPDEAVEFGQGLPMMIKALYFDQYDISSTPVRIRGTQQFLDFIRAKNSTGLLSDFVTSDDVLAAIQSVLTVLENHMDHGQIRQMRNMLPLEIREMIDWYPEQI